jgi:hypothetical protein
MRFFISLILIFASYTIEASQALLKINEASLPLEFVLLAESINELKLIQEEKDKISEKIKLINSNLKFLKKEQIFFILKSELYKSILEREFHNDFRIMKFTNLDISNIEKAYLANKKEYSPFARWLVESVISDFGELKNYPGFNSVKMDVPEKDVTLNLVRKKLSLLSPWLGAISALKASEFNFRLKKMLFEILSDIEISTGIYKNYLTNTELDSSDFITINTITNKKLPIKIKNEDETPPSQKESEDELSISEAGQIEGKKAQKLTESITEPKIDENSENDAKEESSSKNWKPTEEKTKDGKSVPPPAPTWTPDK